MIVSNSNNSFIVNLTCASRCQKNEFLQEHVAGCSDCHALLGAYEFLFIDSSWVVIADRNNRPHRGRKKSVRHFALALSTAALFLISLGLMPGWQLGDSGMLSADLSGSAPTVMVAGTSVEVLPAVNFPPDGTSGSQSVSHRVKSGLLGYSWEMPTEMVAPANFGASSAGAYFESYFIRVHTWHFAVAGSFVIESVFAIFG